MNKDMVDYMNELSSCNLETLEQIISLQYRKFVRFYKLVEGYSGDINKIKYEFNSPSSLDVVLTFKRKKELSKIKNELEDSMKKSSYDGSVKLNKKEILISIELDES